MIASALPGTELMALDYDATMPPQVWKPGCDVALCTVGRVGENLESLQRTTEGLRALTPGISIVALTEEHESELAGRSLIAGADQVQPLPGLTPTLLGVAIKIAYARKLRHDTATRRKEKLPEVPGYRILRQIGEGGMSRVYLAKRGNEESAVVLKIVDAQLARDQKFVLRFARECKVLASIRHENVVRISDFSKIGRAHV